MISYISLIFYVLACIQITLFLKWGSRSFRILFNILMAMGLCFNVIDLVIRWLDSGLAPTSTLYDLLVLLSISFGITYFILYLKYKRPLIGMFIAPFTVFLGILAIFFPPDMVPSYAVVDSIWKYVHLPFIILGTTFLVASFLASIMYLLQEHQLKNKKFGSIFHRFPPLDAIAKINGSALNIGFYFFSIGAVLGFVWMLQNNLEMILYTAKIIFSLLTWGLFALLVFVQRRRPLSPHQMAWWTVIGFISILVMYAGVASFLLR